MLLSPACSCCVPTPDIFYFMVMDKLDVYHFLHICIGYWSFSELMAMEKDLTMFKCMLDSVSSVIGGT